MNFHEGNISCGSYHTCALSSENIAFCWGRDDYGQLGTCKGADSSVPNQICGLSSDKSERIVLAPQFKQISAGHQHTCAVAVDGSGWCWGSDTNGQLGTGEKVGVHRSSLIPLGIWRQISAGGQHSCGIQHDGSAWCWGSDEYGQLGSLQTTLPGSIARSPQKLRMNSNWLQLSCGYRHTCGIRGDGDLWCWGDNTHGQLANKNS